MLIFFYLAIINPFTNCRLHLDVKKDDTDTDAVAQFNYLVSRMEMLTKLKAIHKVKIRLFHISLQVGWLGYCNIPAVFLSKTTDPSHTLIAT